MSWGVLLARAMGSRRPLLVDPSHGIDARGDDLAVVVAGQAQAIGPVAVGIGIARAVHHGGQMMDATIHGGHLDAGAGVFTPAHRIPGHRRLISAVLV